MKRNLCAIILLTFVILIQTGKSYAAADIKLIADVQIIEVLSEGNEDTTVVRTSGTEIVDKIVTKATKALKLTEDQVGTFRNALAEAFAASGKDIEGSYTAEESKLLNQSLLKGAKPALMEMLDETQKTLFKEKMSDK